MAGSRCPRRPWSRTALESGGGRSTSSHPSSGGGGARSTSSPRGGSQSSAWSARASQDTQARPMEHETPRAAARQPGTAGHFPTTPTSNRAPTSGTVVGRAAQSVPGNGGTAVVIPQGYYGGFYPWGYAGLGFGGYYGGYYGSYDPGAYGGGDYGQPNYKASGSDNGEAAVEGQTEGTRWCTWTATSPEWWTISTGCSRVCASSPHASHRDPRRRLRAARARRRDPAGSHDQRNPAEDLKRIQ